VKEAKDQHRESAQGDHYTHHDDGPPFESGHSKTITRELFSSTLPKTWSCRLRARERPVLQLQECVPASSRHFRHKRSDRPARVSSSQRSDCSRCLAWARKSRIQAQSQYPRRSRVGLSDSARFYAESASIRWSLFALQITNEVFRARRRAAATTISAFRNRQASARPQGKINVIRDQHVWRAVVVPGF
jgi:hypothetical protein